MIHTVEVRDEWDTVLDHGTLRVLVEADRALDIHAVRHEIEKTISAFVHKQLDREEELDL